MTRAELAREAERIALRLARIHPDPEAQRIYQELAERAGRDARARSKRSRPPASWEEPKLEPVYEFFRVVQDAAREAGEEALASSLNDLFGIWTHGRMADAQPEIAELYRQALRRAGEADDD